MKTALIKPTRSHCKGFGGWELSAAPTASTAGLGLQALQEESRRASLRYKHTSAQIQGRIWGQPGRLHSQNHKIQLLGYIK